MFISLLVLYSDIYVLIRMDCCGFVQFNHNTVVCHTVGAFYWDTIYRDLGVLGGLAGLYLEHPAEEKLEPTPERHPHAPSRQVLRR